MCQYLFASSVLRGPDEGLSEAQAEAVAAWRVVLPDIASDEMLRLALVAT